MALGRGHRDREDDLDVGQRRPRPAEQALLDVEDHLALDQQVVVEDRGASWVRLTVPSIEFSMATKPTSTSPSATACSTIGIDGSGTSSPAARSGCAQQRLLGERAERPEEPDPQAGAVEMAARLAE